MIISDEVTCINSLKHVKDAVWTKLRFRFGCGGHLNHVFESLVALRRWVFLRVLVLIAKSLQSVAVIAMVALQLL